MLDSSWPAFIGFTLLVMGWVAFMIGQALAFTWRPWWYVIPYTFILGIVDRLLVFTLFGSSLFSMNSLVVDTMWLELVGLLTYRITLTRKMVVQYPWLYTRNGLLGWRERIQHD